MKTEIKTVTPTMAKEFLGRNTINRNVNSDIVYAYSKSITEGNWMMNGESIKFNVLGEMNDGQHRCHAIIKANMPIRTLLVYDLPVESFKTIDTGKKRNGSDILKIEGVQNATNISSAVSKYLSLKNGRYSVKVSSCSNKNVFDEYELNSELYQHLHSKGQEFYRSNYHIITPAEYSAFYRYFQLKYSNETIDSFFKKIENKDGVCGLLFNKLMNEQISKRVLRAGEKQALIIKTFIYYVTGKDVKLLKYSIDETFPTILK